jgi:hypothetical protein
MHEMLILNPAPRKKARKSRKAPSAAQKRARAAFGRAAKARAAKRRSVAVSVSANPRKRRVKRRASNPVARSYTRRVRRNPVRAARRRRNPISAGAMGGGLFNLRSYIAPLKDAAVMGAGAVAVDVGFGYLNRFLPPVARVMPNKVGAGDVVKMLLTVAIGKVLDKPTRGLSKKAAMGSLIVQMRDVTLKLMPASMGSAAATAATVNGVGFVSPGYVVQGRTRANTYTTPQRGVNAMPGGTQPSPGSVGMIQSGRTPLVSGVGMIQSGRTPLVSGLRGFVR